MGIPGNENVDKAAKNALLLPNVSSSFLPTNSDILFIKKFIASPLGFTLGRPISLYLDPTQKLSLLEFI